MTSLEGLPDTLVEAILTRARYIAEDPVAILATGSYAAGTAAPSSDLDLTVIRRSGRSMLYHTWFVPGPAGPLHISADFPLLPEWHARRDEPADWSLGFPTEEPVLTLWDTEWAHLSIGDAPTIRRPAPDPELEDFFEGACKVRRALAHRDMPGARWHAQAMAVLAPGLLVPLNAPRRIRDRRDALQAALDLAVAPAHYAIDLPICLGLTSANDGAFAVSTQRLARELLTFIRERLPTVDPAPWLAQYLADGTLERQFERLCDAT